MTSIIINTLNHNMSAEQVASLPVEGTIVHVRDWAPELAPMFANSSADSGELSRQAYKFASRLLGGRGVDHPGVVAVILPGGSPAWMFAIARYVGRFEGSEDPYYAKNIKFLFAHSERVSVEETQPDGSVRKTAVFQHRGWIVL